MAAIFRECHKPLQMYLCTACDSSAEGRLVRGSRDCIMPPPLPLLLVAVMMVVNCTAIWVYNL